MSFSRKESPTKIADRDERARKRREDKQDKEWRKKIAERKLKEAQTSQSDLEEGSPSRRTLSSLIPTSRTPQTPAQSRPLVVNVPEGERTPWNREVFPSPSGNVKALVNQFNFSPTPQRTPSFKSKPADFFTSTTPVLTSISLGIPVTFPTVPVPAVTLPAVTLPTIFVPVPVVPTLARPVNINPQGRMRRMGSTKLKYSKFYRRKQDADEWMTKVLDISVTNQEATDAELLRIFPGLMKEDAMHWYHNDVAPATRLDWTLLKAAFLNAF
jgi:hypothetical protein